MSTKRTVVVLGLIAMILAGGVLTVVITFDGALQKLSGGISNGATPVEGRHLELTLSENIQQQASP